MQLSTNVLMHFKVTVAQWPPPIFSTNSSVTAFSPFLSLAPPFLYPL